MLGTVITGASQEIGVVCTNSVGSSVFGVIGSGQTLYCIDGVPYGSVAGKKKSMATKMPVRKSFWLVWVMLILFTVTVAAEEGERLDHIPHDLFHQAI